MSIFSRKKAKPEEKSFDTLTGTITTGNGARMPSENWTKNKTEMLNMVNDWVYIAASAIAKNIAKVEWKVYSRRGKGEELTNSPVNEMFANPNGNQTWYELMYITTMLMQATGEAYCAHPFVKPLDIRILRPDKVNVKGRTVTYSSGSKIVQYSVEEVTMFNMPSHLSTFGGSGYSPMRGASGFIQRHAGMTVAEFQSFKQAVINQLLVRVSGEFKNNTKGKKSIVDKIRRYFGADNAGKILAVAGVDGIDRVGLKPTDIMSPDLERNIGMHILNSYGVPPEIVGMTDSSNRSTSEESQQIFVENALEPMLRLIAGKLNKIIPVIFPGALVKVVPVIPYPEMWQRRIDEEAHDLSNGVRTINEVREARGLKKYGAEFDQPWLPMNLVPASLSTFTDSKSFNIKTIKGVPNARVIQLFSRIHRAWELKYANAVTRQVYQPISETLIAMLPEKAIKGINPADVGKKMQELYQQYILDGAGADMATTAADMFGLSPDLTVWRRSYGAWFEVRGADFWEKTTMQQVPYVDELIGSVLSGDKSRADAITLIKSVYGRPRALRVARTEVTAGMNGGALSMYKSNGIDGKEWITTLDEVTRDDHADADGQTVSVNDSFMVGGFSMEHPGDPSAPPEQIVNCRCAIAPVVE